MISDRDSKREMIITMTSVEIMLILVVVVLFLLVIKNTELVQQTEQVQKLEEEFAILSDEDIQNAGEARAAKYVGGKVTQLMASAGKALSDSPLSESKHEIVATVSLLLENSRQHEALREKLSGLINREGSAEQYSDDQILSKLSVIVSDAEIGQKVRDSLPLHETFAASPAEIAEQVGERLDENEVLREQLGYETSTEKTADVRKRNLRDKIGFLPCWIRGNSSYYFAYDITYYPASQKYKISVHKDLENNSDPIVSAAIRRGLPSLLQYPQDLISIDELIAFGQQLNKEKTSQYGQKCWLVATISKKGVDGTIIEPIRDKAHFYPIYR